MKFLPLNKHTIYNTNQSLKLRETIIFTNKHTKIQKIKYLEKYLEINNMLHNYKCKV